MTLFPEKAIYSKILLQPKDLKNLCSIGEAIEILYACGFNTKNKPHPNWLKDHAISCNGNLVFKRGAHPNDAFKEMDCSTFTANLFRTHFGLKLPRRSVQMYELYKESKVTKPEYFDLVFFDGVHNRVASDGTTIGHVAVYGGDGDILHMTQSKGLMVEKLTTFEKWSGRKIQAICRPIEYEPSILLEIPGGRFIESPDDLYWIVSDVKNGIIKKKTIE